ncbi:GNAT family N-acetyltransferase [Anianabacter salinae]|uniref:GNAT family N-acetyltransferase n=1 Tax=Anianabacter salinae TaxID=2851023 RepID=UPI00225E5C8E|nr:GNAT family protein [Anianabacter salinae]MBV0912635.1 GNAT family N-acetyltransferase [Anianabacter salinae]
MPHPADAPLVPGWTPPPLPGPDVMEGRLARLERLGVRHAAALHAANAEDDAIWKWLPYGPFGTEAAYLDWMQDSALGADPMFYAIMDRTTGQWGGVASYLRITPAAGSIEVGHINFAPALQRTPAATEAMYLMMRWAFGAGYRRYEWKCNALNLGSRRAAQRLGLSYEGIFRQAAVVKGRNRDTAWFAAIDAEWPALQAAFKTWLDLANFDAEGRQRQSLSELTAPILVARDPALAGRG